MANEGVIKVSYPVSGLATLTAEIRKPDDTIRDGQDDVALNDTGHPYLYTNPGAITIESGDSIIPLLSGAGIGAGQTHRPEVNAVEVGGLVPAGYVGDYELLETVYFTFSTNKTLSSEGNGLRVFKNNETTPLTTAQATLDIDIGSESNVHSVSVVLGQANYDAEEDYNVVLSGATIGGETVTAVVGTFSIENRWQAPKHRHVAP